MADPRLTVVKMLMKMDSSEAYSNLLLDHVFSETDLSERDKAFAAALFYGVLERRLTLDYIIEKNSKIPFAKLDPAALTEDYPERMRKFIEGADIITPNITEACLLTGRSFNPCPTLHETKEMLRELCGFGVRFAVITGFSEKGQLGAVGCFDGAFTECLTPKKDVACSGTGDVFASALLGAVLRGADYPQALEIATKFTYAAVEYTAAASDRRFYGIHFQPVLGEYIRMLERVEKGRSDG